MENYNGHKVLIITTDLLLQITSLLWDAKVISTDQSKQLQKEISDILALLNDT